MTDLPVPVGDPAGEDDVSVELVAAALRADAADVDTLVGVLGSSLPETLPAGMVEVERSRTLADRLARREGQPVAITVSTPELALSLRLARSGAVQAEAQRRVRGVVISRQEVSVDQWVELLAGVLTDLAARNADARQALGRLLGG
jgi:hypothetical protein